MSAWIKCSDRLPGSGLVLAYAPRNSANPMGAISVEQAKSVVWWHGQYPMTYFTHWMRLPDAPEESISTAPGGAEGEG